MSLNAFNSYLTYARRDLEQARRSKKHKASWLANAAGMVRWALGEANRMRDRKRAALCLRILNWIRADIARTV